MAFGFFRRHQKMVVVIMAVLMISFLVGPTFFKSFLQKQPGDVVLGHMGESEITVNDLRAAEGDLAVLRTIRLADPRRIPWPSNTTDSEYLFLSSNGAQAELAYALLLREAEEMDVSVVEQDVDNFFARLGLTGAEYSGLVSAFQSRFGIREERLRSAVARWLKIYKTYVEAQVGTPPSETRVRHLYRELAEKIALKFAVVPAKDFLDKTSEPDAGAVEEQFEKFSDTRAGSASAENPFGFGYRQPDRAGIAYLLVQRRVLERVARPGGKQVRDYYSEHEKEFVKKVPVPSTQPALATTQPTSKPTEYREEIADFSQVKAQIIEKLTAAAVGRRLDETLSLAEGLLAETAGNLTGAEAYRQVVEHMKLPAENILDRPLPAVRIRRCRLDRAVKLLAEAAGIEGICYPWGKFGKIELDKSIRVTLKDKNLTLRQALDGITRQVLSPDSAGKAAGSVDWVMCRGFEGVLFPVGGEFGQAFFPVRVDETAVLTVQELREHDVLGSCRTSDRGGEMLWRIVFTAEPFDGGDGNGSAIGVGDDGPRMYALGKEAGRLLWRIVQAQPAHRPEQITDELRKQVVADLKMQAALELAEKRARKILDAAADSGLQVAAEKVKLAVKITQPFARKQQILPRQEIMRMAIMSGQFHRDMFVRMMLVKPVEFWPSDVAELSLPTTEARRRFVDEAFSLAPPNVEPPYPEDNRVLLVKLPARREVVLIARDSFRPPVQSEYEQHARQLLTHALMEMRRYDERTEWFTCRRIFQRTGFREGQ
ncbi:MAG: hypothetical protein SVT52_09290 [Planctomycetota bacterium]|nr:hypothetical protein [Planctomycetota bacterium]